MPVALPYFLKKYILTNITELNYQCLSGPLMRRGEKKRLMSGGQWEDEPGNKKKQCLQCSRKCQTFNKKKFSLPLGFNIYLLHAKELQTVNHICLIVRIYNFNIFKSYKI